MANMNRRDLLKKLGIGAGVTAAAVVAPKVPETVAEIIDPSGKLPIELAAKADAPTAMGGVPGALRHLVRERAHGRPMGYMESEDGSLVHWHAVKSNGEVVSGTIDRQNPNFGGKNGLAYYAMQNGTKYENPGAAQYREAVDKLHKDGGRLTWLADDADLAEPLELSW